MMCRCATMPETGVFKKAEHLRKNRCSAFCIFSSEKFFWQKERGPDRKFSALLGANGSGKTTLLRSIYRTQKMDSGIVRLDDRDITHFSGKKLAQNMAVMGQFNQINFDYNPAGCS